MTTPPADFGDFLIGCEPAIVMTIVALGGLWAAGWAVAWVIRGFRLLDELTDDGDGQGGIPPLPRRDARTRPMGHAPLGDIVISEEVERYAAYRANAPTQALDPDPALGCPFCSLPFDPGAGCLCASWCKDPQCGYLQWLQAGEQS